MARKKFWLTQFNNYASGYDLTDVKIRLKYEHMLRVADRTEIIARSLGYSGKELDFIWLTGLLHDIGRFEQVKQYGTFIDARSVDHAKLSARILFNDGLIRHFTDDSSYDELISKSISWHSLYRLPEDNEWAKIVRDADKLDIFRVMTETPLEDIYNVTTEELYNSDVTPEVLNCFNEKHAVLRSLKRTPIDNLVGHICLYYELEFEKSRELAIEEGYLAQMLNFESNNDNTNIVLTYIKENL